MSSLNARFLLAVLLVLILTIIPLPSVIAVFRPPWVLMFVLYVQFYLPRYFRVSWVFILGLSMDVLLASVFGEHAFALLLTSCLAAGKARRFYFFSITQQMFLVALLCMTYQLLIVLIDNSLGYSNKMIFAIASVAVTMIFWPWVKLLADNTLGCMDNSR